MPRKPHKKSRFGCSNCKKRHQKCDETRPTCVNCRTAGSECSYLSASSVTRRPNVAIASGSTASPASENTTPISQQQKSPLVTSTSTPFIPTHGSAPDVNMTHIRLFHHFLENSQQVFGLSFEHPELQQSLMVKYGLKHRFLMTLILAVTSIRQSIDIPSKGPELYQQSMELLDAGLRELYKATENINEGNIAPIFLATSITGMYMLCDTFIIPHDEPTDVFFDRIVNTMRVMHGARVVMADGHWMFLANSEIRPMLGFDLRDVRQSDKDEKSQFRTLFNLTKASNLPEDELAACDAAIDQLMRSYGANSASPHLQKASRFLRGRAWPVTTSQLFVDMLARRVPEALIILAHWSILLHQLSDVWAIGEAGQQLMKNLNEMLDPTWDDWLAWPRTVVAGPKTPATTPNF